MGEAITVSPYIFLFEGTEKWCERREHIERRTEC